MKKLRFCSLLLGSFFPFISAYALDYPLHNGWYYNTEIRRASNETVVWCRFIFAESKIIEVGGQADRDCGVLKYFVDLRERKVYAARDVIFSHDIEQFGFNKELTDELYNRLETLRNELLDSEARQEYLKAFEAAQSLVLINEFINKYANQDPDSLIPKLAPLKAQLEHQEYLDLYVQAGTKEKLENFIERYENNDPDELVLKAKNRFTKIKIKERAEQDILENKIFAEKKQREIDSVVMKKQRDIDNLASKILWCNRQILFAHKTINKEREIAQVSGYENKFTLRQAGEIIVNCRNSIKQDFEDYRKKGGTRSLSELNN